MNYLQEQYFYFFLFFFLLSAVFSGIEAAYLSLSRIDKNRFQDNTNWISKKINYLINHFDYLLTSILFFNLLNNMFAVWSSTALVQQIFPIFFSESSPSIVWKNFFLTLFQTFIIILFCEFTPKRFCIKYNYLIVFFTCLFVLPIYFIFFPISWIYKKISHFVFFILGDKEEKEVLDKNEFISYVKEGSKSGVLNEIESKMLENLMSYKDFPVKKLLIPRQKMVGFNLDNLPENLIQAVKKFKYNTIPVFDKLKDHIVGVFTKRTLLNKNFGEKIDKEMILKIIENPYIVPENKDIVDVLIDLQKLQHEICLVSDEHGGTEGIVTRSDIINKLFGRIENGEIEQETIKLIEKNQYRINPNVPLEEFNEYFKIEFKSEYCKTIGGYIIEKLHNIPRTGDKIKIESFSFHIKKATRRKIISMILTKVK